MKTKRENEKEKEVSTLLSQTIFSTKSIMLTRAMPQMDPPRSSSSSLSLSLPEVPISTPTWLKYVRDDFFIPPNGFHHLRGLFPQNIIIPKQIFPTWSIYRTSFSAIPLVTTAKSCFPFSSTFHCKSKLTLFYAGIQNSWANSLHTIYDVNQIKGAFNNEGQDHSPSHLKFFLLIFAKDEAQSPSPSPRRPKPKAQKAQVHLMKGKAKY